MFCLVFFVFLENVSLIWWRHRYERRATYVPSFYRAFRVELSCRSRSDCRDRGSNPDPPRARWALHRATAEVNRTPKSKHILPSPPTQPPRLQKKRERVETKIKTRKMFLWIKSKTFLKGKWNSFWQILPISPNTFFNCNHNWYMFESGRFCKAQLLSNYNRYLLEAGMWQNLQRFWHLLPTGTMQNTRNTCYAGAIWSAEFCFMMFTLVMHCFLSQ